MKKTAILAIIGPGDPDNRVPRAILRRLAVGELRRIFKRFYAKLRDGVGHQNPLAPTINCRRCFDGVPIIFQRMFIDF